MPPRDRSTLSLTGAQAQYVVTSLLKDRRISERDVRVSLAQLDREIVSLEGQLSALRDALGSGGQRTSARAAVRAPAAGVPAGPGKRRRPNLTPARRAELRLQGLYLALMRQIPKTKRPHFKSIFKRKGAPAALAAMKKAVGK